MTEQDLDRLFSKSKQKSKLKTQVIALDDRGLILPQTGRKRDFTCIKFLQMEDDYDRMLTGLPISQKNKENVAIEPSVDFSDLTLKFKKDYMVGKVIGEGAYASVRVAIFRP